MSMGRPLRSSQACTLRNDDLNHPRRRLLLKFIRKSPGAGFREVARGAGLAPGTAPHHLTVLVRSGVVAERVHEATTRFFPAGKDGNWIEVVLRRDPALAFLHDWLKLNPRASQGDVL